MVRFSSKVLPREQAKDAFETGSRRCQDCPKSSQTPLLIGLDAHSSGSSADFSLLNAPPSSSFFVSSNRWLQFCYLCQKITNSLSRHLDGSHILQFALDSVDMEALGTLGGLIQSIVDFPESQLQERVSVSRGICAELDEMKRNYAGLDSFLAKVATHVCQSIELEKPLLYHRFCRVNLTVAAEGFEPPTRGL